MKTIRTLAMLLFTSTFLASFGFAQTPEAVNTQVNYSPYFAKVGRTIFVSGPSSQWFGKLMEAFRWTGEVAVSVYNKDPAQQVDLVVFVNATSAHQERTDSSWSLIRRFSERNISTKIVGECDMFCARLFIAGKTREFGQNLNGKPARLKIQVPVEYSTKLIERNFPNTQIALYENLLPEFTSNYRELLVRGFTKPTDTTGGVFIGPSDVKYCATLKSDCENYAGLDAFKMGLTTSPERTPVTLPERFPAPVPTGYASVDDSSKVPKRGDKTLDGYAEYLRFTLFDDRAFAISEADVKGAWAWARGTTKDGEDAAARALRRCEVIAKAQCRLYASGNEVVW